MRGTDNRVYVNRLDAHGNWSGWSELPGGGGGDASGPVAVGLNGEIYVFVRGTDNRVYVDRLDADGNWSGWSELPGDGEVRACGGCGQRWDIRFCARTQRWDMDKFEECSGYLEQME